MPRTVMTRLFALCAFGAVLVHIDTARADFCISVDCHGNDGLPGWAKTGNTITVESWFQSFDTERKYTWSFVPDQCSDDHWWDICYATSAYPAGIERIRISTNGHNAFWIDKVWLSAERLRYTGDGKFQWGVDNNRGWCLSTDASDGNNAYCSGPATRTLDLTR